MSNLFAVGAALAVVAGSASAQYNLITNGNFEFGVPYGWQYLATATSSFAVTNDAQTGSFGGALEEFGEANAAVLRQANLGAGLVQPGETITISFWAKAVNGDGGVNFAEFYSESTTIGVTKSEILGGGPLFAPDDHWQHYVFTTTAGPDVSAGVTFQITATTGAIIGTFSQLYLDNVSVTIDSVQVCPADINGDGVLNLDDINEFAAAFLGGC
ncbi:MAG: carbohydrate binding domain-containing protein [Phycisphaerales bacterium]